MNSFGRIFRISVFGESHGECVGITIDGCPAGLSISPDDLAADLERRKGGKQKGTTPRQEEDFPIFKSGIFNGKTTGFPITILFENKNIRSEDYAKQRSIPRPGHADWVAHQKFGGFEDYRGGGHFSARMTAGIVAAGAIAKKLMNYLTSPQTPLQRRGAPHSDTPGYITNSHEQGKYSSDHAKFNRQHQTLAEEKLWDELRNKKLAGFKFRRQHPIEAYIPDFVCLEKKLVVQVDGGHHDDDEQKKIDEIRTKTLQKNNFQLIRFTNEEVLNKTEWVLEKIKNYLVAESNSPSPSERESEGEVLNPQVTIHAQVVEIGGEKDPEKGLQKAIDAKDSVGGIVECKVNGLPVGLGEPWIDSVESVLAHFLFAIPAVKGVEFGAGFAAAGMFGSEHNDAIMEMGGKTKTNHAGGIVGGITNGNELVFRLAIKPTSSTPKEQESLNWDTEQVEKFSIKGRHDLCVALRAPVIVEAVTAIALCDLMMLEQRIPRIINY
jgi:chorismate synthase